MIKELKYFFFILVIFMFVFFNLKFYFSDNNKKNSHRSLIQIDKKIIKFSKNTILLGDNTNDVVKYVEKIKDKNKRDYNFWKLIYDN